MEFSSLALKRWLETENVELQLNTTKTGVAGIEMLHKTINEKIRIIKKSDDNEAKLSKIETILYIYNNNKTKHDTTGKNPAYIFIYAGQPILDTQHNKEIKVNEINKDRNKYNDTRYRKGPLQKGKFENPFKLTRNVEQTDEDHYKINNRNRETHYYQTQFKKQKKINKLPIPQASGSS